MQTEFGIGQRLESCVMSLIIKAIFPNHFEATLDFLIQSKIYSVYLKKWGILEEKIVGYDQRDDLYWRVH